MSTKVGISHNDKYYLYHECFENNNFIYLRLDTPTISFSNEGPQSEVTIKIDIKTWRAVIEGWNKSSWSKHPEWDNKVEEYDLDGLLNLLERTANKQEK